VNDQKLNELPVFTKGLPQLPPDGEVSWMLGPAHLLVDNLPPFVVTAEYRYVDEPYTESYLLSLETYRGTILPPKSEEAKEIEDLRKELAKLSSSVKKIADKPDPLPPLGPW
jgi:hypothetical protein